MNKDRYVDILLEELEKIASKPISSSYWSEFKQIADSDKIDEIDIIASRKLLDLFSEGLSEDEISLLLLRMHAFLLKKQLSSREKYLEEMSKEVEETWRIVPNSNKYEVSTLGRIRMIDNPTQIHIGSPSRYNYLRFSFKRMGKTLENVHRVIAETFHEQTNFKPELYINHINEDTFDNRVENLEAVTVKQNNNHGTSKKRISHKLSKKFNMLDDDGNIVETFNSSDDAIQWIKNTNPDLNPTKKSLYTAIHRKTKLYGYYWESFSTKDTF